MSRHLIRLQSISKLAMPSPTPFTQMAQMRPIVILPLAKDRRLDFHIMPLPQSMHHPLDIRLPINLRPAKCFARLAALMENPRVVPILSV
jgi:hypothetical protein